jgi:hypothetical protein
MYRKAANEVDYYFFYGPDFDHIIDLYRTMQLARRQCIPNGHSGCSNRRTGINEAGRRF